MKNKILLSSILLCLSSTAFSQSDIDVFNTDQKDPELTVQELKALELSQKIQNRNTIPATEGDNGYVQYVYGAQKATIVCTPLKICDIQLQTGESVQYTFIGDSSRWVLEPALVGSGGIYSTEHVIVKPLDTGLNTNLVIATDRRIYHINLVSHKTKYMPQVSFVYPEDAMAKFKAKQANRVQQIERQTIPETGEILSNLDFDYEITGDKPVWFPVRAYNDGTRTIIEMPKTMTSNECPALIVTKYNSDSKDTEQLVNYRVQNNKFIVDAIFFEAELIAGVGKDQTKVIVKRSGK